jgi:hypothetical protein
MGQLGSLDRVSTGQEYDILTTTDKVSTTAPTLLMNHGDLHRGLGMIEEIFKVFPISISGNIGHD